MERERERERESEGGTTVSRENFSNHIFASANFECFILFCVKKGG